MKSITPILPAALLSISLWAGTATGKDCDHTQLEKRIVELGGVEIIKVAAGAGSLEIIGEDDRDDILIDAEMCSTDKQPLADMSVFSKVENGTALIETRFPKDDSWFGEHTARIALTLLVPAAAVLDVVDSSGKALIQNVGKLNMVDSSGSLKIEDIDGDLRVRDSSGSINIDQIKGQVFVTDSSGDIKISDVEQTVVIEADSSGSIKIKDVGGDIVVKKDSSGSIEVKDVGGDFIVEKDSTGGISHKNVAGKVQLPD
ncbi:MAG: hypothetical protein KJP04_06060 [Arenicella sp.]|nr:hypothetical protein [Arenicella sp.]